MQAMAAAERDALLAALAFQVEAGIDETIGETPCDWSQAFATAAPAKAADQRASAPARGPSKPAEQTDTRTPAARTQDEALASARALAHGAHTLEALREALAGFEGSTLRAGATNCVFSDGSPNARLMIIGEAPGREEDKQGKPFVGRSGQLLDAMLGAIGLDRRSEDAATGAYITNVVPFRPLQNRTPSDAEVALLIPFLERHIALAKPDIVLCIGNVPAKHVMGASRGITQYRGTWTELTIEGRFVPALASFHPAYLLRSPEMKRHAWRDLLSLEERLKTIG